MTEIIRQAQRDVTRAWRAAGKARDKDEMRRLLLKLWAAQRKLARLKRRGR